MNIMRYYAISMIQSSHLRIHLSWILRYRAETSNLRNLSKKYLTINFSWNQFQYFILLFFSVFQSWYSKYHKTPSSEIKEWFLFSFIIYRNYKEENRIDTNVEEFFIFMKFMNELFYCPYWMRHWLVCTIEWMMNCHYHETPFSEIQELFLSFI